jgi:peptidoglycan/LPS O-acetylase OafA/YrhL
MGAVSNCPRDHRTYSVGGFSRSSPDSYCAGLRDRGDALRRSRKSQRSHGGVFWFVAWFLGVASYRILRAGLVPLPAGLLGAGLIIAGMAIARFKIANVLETDMIVAAGTAIAIACRPPVEFPFAPRLFGWAAGFSYTLYAIHFPLVYFIADIFQNIGFPRDQVPPSPRAFMEFGVTIAICLLAAFLVSLVTERKTGRVRAAMLRMCPLRPHRKAEYTG